MSCTWGSKQWQVCSAICIIFIFGYGTYTVVMDIMVGHYLWWYNLALPIFALTILGLLLLVRQGWVTLRNIVNYGFNPSPSENQDESEEPTRDYEDNIYPEDEYFPEDDE